MKKISVLLFSMTLLLGMTSSAQTVDEIVAKHVAAIGGKEKLDAVKSAVYETSMNIMGTDAPVLVTQLVGKGYKTESEFNGTRIINAYQESSGWMVNPMAGANDPQPMSALMYSAGRDNLYVDGALQDYQARGVKLALDGVKKGNYVISVTNGSTHSTYFIDTSTYFVTKTILEGEMMGQPAEITITNSDFRQTDAGLIMPFASQMDLGAFSLDIKVLKAEFNKEIDPKVFDMPK